MNATVQFLVEHTDEMIYIVGGLLSVASVITGLTPTPDDDAVVHKLIDWFSFLKPKTADGTLKLPFTSTKG